ncbi:MAG: SRPBCC domain-containing protein [Bacteroidota bacterium]
MELKTKVSAEEGSQQIIITREFDLPVALLFKAYTNPELIQQWMDTKVLKLENKRHGSFQFETTDPNGNKQGFNGTIHELEENQKITRTFEMECTSFPVQLEFIDFEEITLGISKLTMRIVFRSIQDKDNMLKIPFAQGINMAYDRLQEICDKLKNKQYESIRKFN